jgi:hypothetical protein
MSLEFKGAPDWLLQDYMNRKSTGQTVMEGIGSIADIYLQHKKQQQDKAFQQKNFENQEASRKAAQFGAVAPYVPEAQIPATAKQYGINIPQAQPAAQAPINTPIGQAPLGTPAEEEAQQSLPGEHPVESPIIQHWNSMQGPSAAPARPTSKFGRDQYAKALQIQKTERDLAVDPNAPVPVMSRDEALKAGSINPKTKVLDDGSRQEDKNTRTAESNLRNQFLTQSKDFNDMTRGYQRVADASKDPSAAGDLGLLYGYMKILDPGSVVRESEFATAENTAGVPERIRQVYNKALRGERLTPNMRQDFLNQAKSLYVGQQSIQKRNRQEFERIAASSGLDPKRVIVDTSIPEQDLSSSSSPASAQGWDNSKEARYQELLRKRGGK